MQIGSNHPAPSNGGLIYRFFLACRPCGPAGWLALLLTKAGDDEINPGPTTLNKRVWICDIFHKQIHVRKQISIRCNRIEHWVHLRCAGIRQAQYTDTWTCHLHRESRLSPHTDITPPHRSRPWSKLPTHSPPRVQNRRSLLAKCECERLRSSTQVSTQVSTLARNIEYQKAKRHRGCLHYDLFIAQL